MALFRCSVVVAFIAILMGLSPLWVSYIAGGWVRIYTHNPANFTFDSIPDLSGKVAIVTGANTGIGKVSAREMARKGAHVIVAARSVARGTKAVEDILKEVGADKKVQFMELDLSSFASIRNFAANFLAQNLPLHILLLNAGVMMCPYAETADGFEMQIGTNHIGHYLLVQLLQAKVIASAPSRVVVVSSLAHEDPYKPEGIRLNQFQSDLNYDIKDAYGQSKLANLLMSNALARRLEGKKVYVNSCHPGLIETDLFRHIEGQLDQTQFGWAIKALLAAFIGPGMFTPDQGALTQLYLCTHPDIESNGITGQYFEPVAFPKQPTAQAQNVTLQEALWEYTDELTKAAQAPLHSEKDTKEVREADEVKTPADAPLQPPEAPAKPPVSIEATAPAEPQAP